MTTVALIADTHCGTRNDAERFRLDQEDYFLNQLLPALLTNDIKHLVHLGDYFDRRKYINFVTLAHSKENFLLPILRAGIHFHLIVGNHDTTYKNTHEVVSTRELFRELAELYDNFHLYDKVQTVKIDETQVLMCPWINQENYGDFEEGINRSPARICFGHFEVKDIQMLAGIYSSGGMDRSVFEGFDVVYSGHYHRPSENGNLIYVGSPYEMTWADYGDNKGIILLDLESLDAEKIQNTNNVFHKIKYYDDVEPGEIDREDVHNKIIKLIVKEKENVLNYDRVYDKIMSYDPFSVDVIEAHLFVNQGVSMDDQVFNKDTLQILKETIDEDDHADEDKVLLKILFEDIYMEAQKEEL